MSLHRFPTRTMALALVMLCTGCRDREITAYRAPKDKPPADQPSTMDQGVLPPGHPPIGTNAVPDTGTLPPGHPPIGANPSAPFAGSDMASTPVPTAGGDGLTWTAPAGWTAKPLGQMRKGSYAVKGDTGVADLSITAFPGATGGLEANLNRWRGQVGLPAASPGDVVADAQKFDSNGLQVVVVDYAGNGTRLVGAIIPYDGNSWFFKLMGPDALVAGQKTAFLEFLHTVKAP